MYRILPIRCFLMSLLVALAQQEDSVQIINPHDRYVRYGDSLEIFCKAGQGYSSKDLVFQLSFVNQKSEIINETTIRLYKEKLKERKQHTYICKNTVTQKNVQQVVTISSPPRNATDFQCKSRNLEELMCEWKTNNIYVPTNYNLTWWLNGNPTTPLTGIKRTSKNYNIYFCVYNRTDSIPVYRPDEKILHFSLNSSNILGYVVQDFFIDHYSIVKPAAPLNLTILHVGPREVILQWNIHYNLQDFLLNRGKGIEHWIEYNIKEINETEKVDATGLPARNSTYTLHISLPYAYVSYDLSIRIKTKEATSDEFWSDKGTINITTEPEVPRRPPETVTGAFLHNTYKNYRSIIIYWKEIEPYERAGPNFTYKILVNTSAATFFVNEKSLRRYEYMNASLDAFDLTIWSFNEKGTSNSSSYMRVPAESEITTLEVNRFTVLIFEDGVYNFSWDAVEDVDNYTLFWIGKEKIRFEYKFLQPNETQATLYLHDGEEYEFYIAANKGTTTSGMESATDCTLQSKNIAIYKFPMKFIKESVESTKVKFVWSLLCKLNKELVPEYNVVLKGLNTEFFNETKIKARGKDYEELEIVGLKPYKKYLFNLTLNTSTGPITFYRTIETHEGIPNEPTEITVIDAKNESLLLSWKQPYELNGDSKHIAYNILYNEENSTNNYTFEAPYSKVSVTQITNLNPYTSYSIKIIACNRKTEQCSNATNTIVAKTRIGEPSPPVNIFLNDQFLSWGPPLKPRGNVAMYEILIQRGNKSSIISNITNKIYKVIGCDMTEKIVKYKVRAVNYDNDDVKYESKWSNEISDRCPNRPNWIFVVVGILVLLSSAKVFYCMYKKWNKMKIEPIFPAGIFVLQHDSVKDNKNDVNYKSNTYINSIKDTTKFSELEPLNKVDACEPKAELNSHVEPQTQDAHATNVMINGRKLNTPDLKNSYIQMQLLDSLPRPKQVQNHTPCQKVSQGYVSANDVLGKHLKSMSYHSEGENVSLSSQKSNTDIMNESIKDRKKNCELEPLNKVEDYEMKVELNDHVELKLQDMHATNLMSNTEKIKTPDLKTSYVQIQLLDSLSSPKQAQTQCQKVSHGYVSANNALSKHLTNMSNHLKDENVSLSSHKSNTDIMIEGIEDRKKITEFKPLNKLDDCDSKFELNDQIEHKIQKVLATNELRNTEKIKIPELNTSYVQMQFLG